MFIVIVWFLYGIWIISLIYITVLPGYNRLKADIKLMLGKHIGFYWMISWKFISPAALMVSWEDFLKIHISVFGYLLAYFSFSCVYIKKKIIKQKLGYTDMITSWGVLLSPTSEFCNYSVIILLKVWMSIFNMAGYLSEKDVVVLRWDENPLII